MKIKHSLFTRREFLNGLLGGWLGALAATLLYPIVKYAFPPSREPDEVTLMLSDFQGLPPGEVKPFGWGAKPAYIMKKENGSFSAFVAVCTHLDCTVAYLPERKKFFCACHEGWYDENGINIAGPPPRPLRRLRVEVLGEKIIVKKEGAG